MSKAKEKEVWYEASGCVVNACLQVAPPTKGGNVFKIRRTGKPARTILINREELRIFLIGVKNGEFDFDLFKT